MMAVLAALMGACFTEPDYPAQPVISLKALAFVQSASGSDTLTIELDFTDGDGDMGIEGNENDTLFNERFYFYQPTGKTDFRKVSNRNRNGRYLRYRDKFSDLRYDTLPFFVRPFNCTNYEVLFTNTTPRVPVDTIYTQANPNYNNFFIDFYIKNGNTFTRYDFNNVFTYPSCELNGFNGRIPVLARDLSRPGPLRGVIKYAMQSPAFRLIFAGSTLKLVIYVQDRSFRRSNVIETGEFTLAQIRR